MAAENVDRGCSNFTRNAMYQMAIIERERRPVKDIASPPHASTSSPAAAKRGGSRKGGTQLPTIAKMRPTTLTPDPIGGEIPVALPSLAGRPESVPLEMLSQQPSSSSPPPQARVARRGSRSKPRRRAASTAAQLDSSQQAGGAALAEAQNAAALLVRTWGARTPAARRRPPAVAPASPSRSRTPAPAAITASPVSTAVVPASSALNAAVEESPDTFHHRRFAEKQAQAIHALQEERRQRAERADLAQQQAAARAERSAVTRFESAIDDCDREMTSLNQQHSRLEAQYEQDAAMVAADVRPNLDQVLGGGSGESRRLLFPVGAAVRLTSPALARTACEALDLVVPKCLLDDDSGVKEAASGFVVELLDAHTALVCLPCVAASDSSGSRRGEVVLPLAALEPATSARFPFPLVVDAAGNPLKLAAGNEMIVEVAGDMAHVTFRAKYTVPPKSEACDLGLLASSVEGSTLVGVSALVDGSLGTRTVPLSAVDDAAKRAIAARTARTLNLNAPADDTMTDATGDARMSEFSMTATSDNPEPDMTVTMRSVSPATGADPGGVTRHDRRLRELGVWIDSFDTQSATLACCASPSKLRAENDDSEDDTPPCSSSNGAATSNAVGGGGHGSFGDVFLPLKDVKPTLKAGASRPVHQRGEMSVSGARARFLRAGQALGVSAAQATDTKTASNRSVSPDPRHDTKSKTVSLELRFIVDGSRIGHSAEDANVGGAASSDYAAGALPAHDAPWFAMPVHVPGAVLPSDAEAADVLSLRIAYTSTLNRLPLPTQATVSSSPETMCVKASAAGAIGAAVPNPSIRNHLVLGVQPTPSVIHGGVAVCGRLPVNSTVEDVSISILTDATPAAQRTDIFMMQLTPSTAMSSAERGFVQRVVVVVEAAVLRHARADVRAAAARGVMALLERMEASKDLVQLVVVEETGTAYTCQRRGNTTFPALARHESAAISGSIELTESVVSASDPGSPPKRPAAPQLHLTRPTGAFLTAADDLLSAFAPVPATDDVAKEGGSAAEDADADEQQQQSKPEEQFLSAAAGNISTIARVAVDVLAGTTEESANVAHAESTIGLTSFQSVVHATKSASNFGRAVRRVATQPTVAAAPHVNELVLLTATAPSPAPGAGEGQSSSWTELLSGVAPQAKTSNVRLHIVAVDESLDDGDDSSRGGHEVDDGFPLHLRRALAGAAVRPTRGTCVVLGRDTPSPGAAILSALGRLTRIVLSHVEALFPHTRSLEVYGGLRDLRAGQPLLLTGRWVHGAAGDLASDTATITGKLASGKPLKKRQALTKSSIPLARLLMLRRFEHSVGATYLRKVTESGSLAAAWKLFSASPRELSDADADALAALVGESCQLGMPYCFNRSQATALVLYQHVRPADPSLNPLALPPERRPVAPFMSAVTPTASPPSGWHNWIDYVVDQLNTEMMDCGVCTPPLPLVQAPQLPPADAGTQRSATDGGSTPQARHRSFEVGDEQQADLRSGSVSHRSSPPQPLSPAAPPSTVGPASELFVSIASNVASSLEATQRDLFALMADEKHFRCELERDERRAHLDIGHSLSRQLVQLQLQRVTMRRGITSVEEELRVCHRELLAEEAAEWAALLEDSSAIRAALQRAHRFSAEERLRLSYIEEDDRAGIVADHDGLFSLARATRQTAPPTPAQVAHFADVAARFMHDADGSELVVGCLAVWTANHAASSAFGMHGGAPLCKAYLEQYGATHADIARSTCLVITHLVALQANHGTVESLQLDVLVRRVLACHPGSRSTQGAALLCLSKLCAALRTSRSGMVTHDGSGSGLQSLLSTVERIGSQSQRVLNLAIKILIAVAEAPTGAPAIHGLGGTEIIATAMSLAATRKGRLDQGTLCLYLSLVKRVALSSRAARNALVDAGTALYFVRIALTDVQTFDDVAQAKALRCAERLCGNVGDTTGQVLGTMLSGTLDAFVRNFDGARTSEATLQLAHRLLCRLALAELRELPPVDERLAIYYRAWSTVSIERSTTAPPRPFGSATIPAVYGELVRGTLQLGEGPTPFVARLVRHESVVAAVQATIAADDDDASVEEAVENASRLYERLLQLHVNDVSMGCKVRTSNGLRCLGGAVNVDAKWHLAMYETPPRPLSECLRAVYARGDSAPISVGTWVNAAVALLRTCATYVMLGRPHGWLTSANIFCDGANTTSWSAVIGPPCALDIDITGGMPQSPLVDAAALHAVASEVASSGLDGDRAAVERLLFAMLGVADEPRRAQATRSRESDADASSSAADGSVAGSSQAAADSSDDASRRAAVTAAARAKLPSALAELVFDTAPGLSAGDAAVAIEAWCGRNQELLALLIAPEPVR